MSVCAYLSPDQCGLISLNWILTWPPSEHHEPSGLERMWPETGEVTTALPDQPSPAIGTLTTQNRGCLIQVLTEPAV
jgi:hypothetical protein